ncbi:MAG: RHS repeat-associated core domain-containing protein [Nanoarchaeota archaeon]
MRRDSVNHVLAIVATALLVIVAFGFAGRAIVLSMQNQVGQAGIVSAGLDVPSAPLRSSGGDIVYVYGSRLVASKSDDMLRYHVQDMLSSNTLVVNDEGLLQSKFAAYPYGKSLIKESFAGSSQKYTFTGKEIDNNLMYYGARYYDPRIGRFISVDPVPDNHPFAYSNNNPIKYIDPNGENPLLILIPLIPAATQYAQAMATDPTIAIDFDDLSRGVSNQDYLTAGFALFGIIGPGSGRAMREGASRVTRLFSRSEKVAETAVEVASHTRVRFSPPVRDVSEIQRLRRVYDGSSGLQALDKWTSEFQQQRLSPEDVRANVQRLFSGMEAKYGLKVEVVAEGAVQANHGHGNLATLSARSGYLTIERQVFNDPNTLLSEVRHEYGAFLLFQEYGGRQNLPRIQTSVGEHWATHLLDWNAWKYVGESAVKIPTP